jgi:hypothetical protein
MKRSWVIASLVLAVLVGVGAVYYATAWMTARSMATSMALTHPAPGVGLADPSWAEQLGRPTAGELSIYLATVPQIASPTDVTFWFVLSNAADKRVPQLTVYVQERFGASGWHVVKRGVGG